MADPTPVNSQITDAVSSEAQPNPTPGLPLGKFVWHDLMTTDVEKARSYYADLLGWTYKEVAMEGFGMYPMIQAGGEDQGGLVHLDPAQSHASHWISYVTVEDVDAAVARAVELGGQAPVPGTDIPGVGRFAVIVDAKGAAISPYRPLTPRGEGYQGPARPGTFCWHELLAADSAAEGPFFAEVFDWTLAELPVAATGTYFIFRRKDRGVDAGGMLPKPAGVEGQSVWLPYIAVEDVDKVTARVPELGGKVWRDPSDIPNVGRFSVTADPTGALIAFLQAAQ